jgi:glycosyltransferase involved in cell wall biosynthesis
VNREGLRAKLLFLGRARPNRDLIDRRRDDRFEALLAHGGAFVAANDEWVPYRERLSWLRSGKIAIMLHRRTAEADYSIRTRLFDAIAAGVPVIATAGGFAAELVEQEGLGIVVPPGDVGAVATAIRQLLTDDAFFSACVQSLERIRPRFAWEVVTRPLVAAILQWQT